MSRRSQTSSVPVLHVDIDMPNYHSQGQLWQQLYYYPPGYFEGGLGVKFKFWRKKYGSTSTPQLVAEIENKLIELHQKYVINQENRNLPFIEPLIEECNKIKEISKIIKNRRNHQGDHSHLPYHETGGFPGQNEH